MLTLREANAHALGWNAGNANMRRRGADTWNLDDYAVALRTTNATLDAANQMPHAAETDMSNDEIERCPDCGNYAPVDGRACPTCHAMNQPER